MTGVRVMTYNILMGGRKGSALHQVIRGAHPDVLLVNESPKTPLVWKRRCRRLAEKWDMRWVAGGRDAGSNMIAAREGIGVKSVAVELISQPLLQPRRGVVAAQLRVEGRFFGVVACHLSLDRERRIREVERVVEVAGRLRGPVVVAGDLNEKPGGPSWKRLRQAGFRDDGRDDWPTFPAEKPEARIDALLVRGPARTLSHGDPGVPEQLQNRASDHLAVLAVLELEL